MDEIRATNSDVDRQEASPSTNPLESLLSDPATLAKLSGIMTALQSSKAETPPPPPPSTSTDGLGALLSDPTLAEKLPQVIAMLKPLFAGTGAPPSAAPAVEASVQLPTQSHALDRDHLLLSLKPFLSGERCAAIDSIIRISKLGEVLKQIK